LIINIADIVKMDYIERVTGMKHTKLCLCCWTVTVVKERQLNYF